MTPFTRLRYETLVWVVGLVLLVKLLTVNYVVVPGARPDFGS